MIPLSLLWVETGIPSQNNEQGLSLHLLSFWGSFRVFLERQDWRNGVLTCLGEVCLLLDIFVAIFKCWGLITSEAVYEERSQSNFWPDSSLWLREFDFHLNNNKYRHKGLNELCKRFSHNHYILPPNELLFSLCFIL